MTDEDICGEKTNRTGDPCQRKAGWGTDRDSGPCKNHTEEEREKEKQTLKKVIELMQEELIPIRKACSKADISVPQLHRYRKRYPGLDAQLEDALHFQEEARKQAVEDALFEDAVSGDAAASERIFWLKNRAPGRWEDRKKIDQNVSKTEEEEEKRFREAYRELVEEQEGDTDGASEPNS